MISLKISKKISLEFSKIKKYDQDLSQLQK